ncbi:uncharacterized mitochondrial protein-like protein [Tanacetum coccineum]|uniref:Uncharacterized mitochondrial protein-like protein n=1 Tax=Tanacetum coccineum TaxID=301880 RepID=A0ABQ5D3D3_9ASTR
MVIVRTLLVTAVQHNWHIAQLDINNAFLHGDLHEEVNKDFLAQVVNTKGITMSQREYALELLQNAEVLDLKPSHILVDPIAKLNDSDGELLDDLSQYRTLVGKLLYLTITRPDLSYVAYCLSLISHNLRTPHVKALIKVLRYIKLCPGQGFFFPNDTTFQPKLIVIVTEQVVKQQEGLPLVSASSLVHVLSLSNLRNNQLSQDPL